MATAHSTKASDKQTVCKKLTTALKKRYKAPPDQPDRPVLETMVYAICLENADFEQADAAWERLQEDFFDLNEIRVSSISQLSQSFESLEEPEVRAMYCRNVLQHVFESRYEFEWESIRKKTLDAAARQLNKIKELSAFVRLYTLQHALGGHLIPVDDLSLYSLVWLGLVEPNASYDEAADTMKSVLLKADAPAFCNLLRRLATDPKLNDVFDPESHDPPEEGYDPTSAAARLQELLADNGKAARKSARSKAAAKPGDGKGAKKKSKSSTSSSRSKSKTAGRKKSPAKRTRKS